MNNGVLIPNEIIANKIYLIRDQKVMLDSDLAELYQVATKRLNEQVKRNIERFPSDFMFELTQKEWANLKSQIATSSWGGRRKLPYVFTEHGVLMLSSVLSSKRAIEVNIHIMRVFTKIREMLQSDQNLLLKMQELETNLDKNNQSIKQIFGYIRQLIKEEATTGADTLDTDESTRLIGFKQNQ